MHQPSEPQEEERADGAAAPEETGGRQDSRSADRGAPEGEAREDKDGAGQAAADESADEPEEKGFFAALIERYAPDLTELRDRLFRTVIVLVVLFVVGMMLTSRIMPFIIEHSPAREIQLNTFSPWDAISVYMRFAGIFTLIIGFPYILFQIWGFVSPGLTTVERRTALRYVPGAFVCILIGFVFAYFVVFPTAFYFSNSVTLSLGLKPTYGVKEFFSYMGNILLSISLLFELPIVVMFLTAIRVISPLVLRKIRKGAYVVLTVIASMITPPDFISDILILVPLILLFESSIWLSDRVYRRIQAREQQDQ